MRYVSTDGLNTCDLREAVCRCYAPGRHLYLPSPLPVIPQAFINNICDMSLTEIAYVVMSAFLADTTPGDVLKEVVEDSFNFDIPLRRPGDGPHVLELFGGPTLAFKDISARFMARYMLTMPQRPANRQVMLVATTGNTGSAMARAFADLADISLVILYPRGAMTTEELFRYAGHPGNVQAIEVSGSIADCKRLVREAVTAPAPMPGLTLLCGNTQNIMRLLPQVVYFFHAYARLKADGVAGDGFTLAVPCGNLSNLTSAVMARRMGLPAGCIVGGCATNDTLVRVLDGSLDPGLAGSHTAHSLARAMNTGYPTNLPRLLALSGGIESARLSGLKAVAVGDDTIAATIRDVYARTCYLLDPHTAVAYAAARQCAPTGTPAVVLATAHPAKESRAMRDITGATPALPAGIRLRDDIPRVRAERIPPTLTALRKSLARICS